MKLSKITMIYECTICCEEFEKEQIYRCQATDCDYQLCIPCVKRSFEDLSGQSSKFCPLCKAPLARGLLQSILGKGAVKAVEDELRNKVEFDVQCQAEQREKAKQEMSEHGDKARKLFNKLSEQLNMKCPRCRQVFDDYDGCNALRCGKVGCRAAFCAICLEDCGSDAHAHVRQCHGNLFDKVLFETAKKKREVNTVKLFMSKLDDEAFEVKSLVKNMYEKTISSSSFSSRGIRQNVNAFLANAKIEILSAVKGDRLGVLRNQEESHYRRRGLHYEDVSPRSLVPEDFKLELAHSQSGVFSIELSHRVGYDIDGEPIWEKKDLETFVKVMEEGKDIRRVDALMNIVQSLRCAVVAFSGEKSLYQTRRRPISTNGVELSRNKISVDFYPVNYDGDVSENQHHIGDEMRIIGLNQNSRLMKLKAHIESSDQSVVMFDALRQFIGAEKTKPVFDEIEVPAPKTFYELNKQQRRVAHPLLLRTAMEIAGPPGTGKTKTITELIRCILECTDADAIILSERNGAIDAIAEKFVSRCLEKRKDGFHRIKDTVMWTNLLIFGSSGSIGRSAKLFTLDEKRKYHPDLVEHRRILAEKRAEMKDLTDEMRKTIVERMWSLEGRFSSDSLHSRVRLLNSGKEAGFETANLIINTMERFFDDVQQLLTEGSRHPNAGKLLEKVVADHNILLGKLIPLEEDIGTKVRGEKNFELAKRFKDVEAIHRCLDPIRKKNSFSRSRVTMVQTSIRTFEADLRKCEERVKNDLQIKARVFMSTIGSSHRLPTRGIKDDDGIGDLDHLTEDFEQMELSDCNAIAIFDEAGCIPAYELLGLSRINGNIKALVAVGDKHQLPPYNPSSNNSRKRHGLNIRRQQRQIAPKNVKSILDISERNADDGSKVKLTTQYRVPRDIAEVLNDRIYNGDYTTLPICNVPAKGFSLLHVQSERDEKYVNKQEVEICLQMIEEILRKERGTIMILTPYKKQQHEITYQMKRKRIDTVEKSISILTIDQCQGQEADYVFLSLVQRPTRFLDKHRFNVALSRVRKRLYLITNREEFRRASENPKWDCSLLAKDLLKLHHQKG